MYKDKDLRKKVASMADTGHCLLDIHLPFSYSECDCNFFFRCPIQSLDGQEKLISSS